MEINDFKIGTRYTETVYQSTKVFGTITNIITKDENHVEFISKGVMISNGIETKFPHLRTRVDNSWGNKKYFEKVE